MIEENPLLQAQREVEIERAQSQIVRGLDEDKDKAAKAMQMADGDQDAATYAYGNYDMAYRAYRGNLATHMVNNDPMLQTYFNNNPMASIVSKDDIWALGEYNKAMNPLAKLFNSLEPNLGKLMLDSIDENTGALIGGTTAEFLYGLLPTFAGVAGFGGGASVGASLGALGGPAAPVTIPAGFLLGGLVGAAGSAILATLAEEATLEKFFPEEAKRRAEFKEEHPYAAMGGEILAMAPAFGISGFAKQTLMKQIGSRVLGGTVLSAIQTAQDAYVKGEIDPITMASWFAGGALFAGAPTYFGLKAIGGGEELAARVFGTGRFITEHLRQGEMPPMNVNPVWDKVIAEDVPASMKLYDAAFKTAQQSETKELSAELFAKLSEQHTKGDITLKWDAVRKLYGEELPEAGDALLGDIPGVREQYERSLNSGESISVPWKHWANVDPEVEKVLHDDLRLPNKPSINEAKEILEREVPSDWSPVFENKNEQAIADARTATGLGKPLIKVTPEAQEITAKLTELTKQREELVKRLGPDSIEAGAVDDQIARIMQEAGIKELPSAEKGLEETVLFEPGVILPKRQYERMERDAKKVLMEDEAKKLEVERRKADKRRRPEWNREAARLHKEVSDDIDRKPEWVAWKMMTTGEVGGEKLKPVRINPESLSPEQLKDFPDHWLSKEPTALDIDLAAALTGFKTGDDFVSHMSAFREAKGREAFGQFRAKAIQAEVERQMENRYGRYEDVTAAEARQYVISPNAEDLMWSEYQTLGDLAGLQIAHNRAAVKEMASIDFGTRTGRKSTLKYITEELSRAARKTHDAWQSKDIVGAFMARQEVVHLTALAREAKAWEANERAVKRIMKQLVNPEPTNMDPEFATFAHQIMLDHEIPTKRSQESIDAFLNRPERADAPKNIKDFVNSQNFPLDENDTIAVGLPQGFRAFGTKYNPNMPIWDALLEPGGLHKIYDEMTVDEKRGVGNALRVFKKLGQDKHKGIVYMRGKEVNIVDFANELAAGVSRFGVAAQPWDPNVLGPLKAFRYFQTKLMHMDTLFMRFASQDEKGPWARVMYAVHAADHEYSKNSRELGESIKEVMGSQSARWWNKRVDNTVIKHPIYGTDLPFKNEHLVGLWLATMSEDAINHTAAGYKLEPSVLLAYRDRVTTREHFDMARAIAGKLYEHVQGLEDTMNMARSGALLERTPSGMIQTPWGEFPGMYFPRQRDVAISPARSKLQDHARQWVNMVLPRGWAIERTGEIYPVKLHLQSVASDLQRRVKTTAFQPLADLYNKVLRRPEVEDAIHRSFGPQYVQMIRDYFQDIGGVHGINSGMEASATYWFNSLSRNAITDVISYNLSTLEKHGTQSAIQSALEVGFRTTFKNAMRKLFMSNPIVHDAEIDFMHNGGMVGGRKVPGNEELRKRRHKLSEDPHEISRSMRGKTWTVEKAIQKSSELGGWAIRAVDQTMSEITWLGRYEQRKAQIFDELTKGKQLTPKQWQDAEFDAHQLASDMADRMVRMTHGSMSIVGKAEWLRSQNAMIRTGAMALNFFNNALNRRFRSLYMIQDLVKGRSPRGAMEDMRTIIRDFFTYVFLPTFIEDMVEPIGKEDDDNFTYYSKYFAQALAAPIPILRDFVHAGLTGSPVSYGVYGNLFTYAKRSIQAGQKYALEDDEGKLDDLVENMMGLTGGLFGAPLAVPGRLVGYAMRYHQGDDDLPRDWEELHRVLKKGRTQETREHQRHPHQRLIERWMH